MSRPNPVYSPRTAPSTGRRVGLGYRRIMRHAATCAGVWLAGTRAAIIMLTRRALARGGARVRARRGGARSLATPCWAMGASDAPECGRRGRAAGRRALPPSMDGCA
eukprot:scaffold3980_cov348-Prasinococcus_capsulatus_cf.AAC.5